MRVNRKLMRRFEYRSHTLPAIDGYFEIVKVISEEIPDWKVYQFTQNETVRTHKEDKYKTFVSVITETVIDFPTYNEALAYAAGVEANHKNADEWRTNLPTHPGTYKFNTAEKSI